MAGVSTVEGAISNERLVRAGYYSILEAYESKHSAKC